jgi:hypothetical protein
MCLALSVPCIAGDQGIILDDQSIAQRPEVQAVLRHWRCNYRRWVVFDHAPPRRLPHTSPLISWNVPVCGSADIMRA